MKLDDTMFSLDIPLIVQHLALHILSSLPSFLLGGRWPQSKTYEVTDLSVCKLYRERSDEEREPRRLQKRSKTAVWNVDFGETSQRTSTHSVWGVCTKRAIVITIKIYCFDYRSGSTIELRQNTEISSLVLFLLFRVLSRRSRSRKALLRPADYCHFRFQTARLHFVGSDCYGSRPLLPVKFFLADATKQDIIKMV